MTALPWCGHPRKPSSHLAHRVCELVVDLGFTEATGAPSRIPRQAWWLRARGALLGAGPLNGGQAGDVVGIVGVGDGRGSRHRPSAFADIGVALALVGRQARCGHRQQKAQRVLGLGWA